VGVAVAVAVAVAVRVAVTVAVAVAVFVAVAVAVAVFVVVAVAVAVFVGVAVAVAVFVAVAVAVFVAVAVSVAVAVAVAFQRTIQPRRISPKTPSKDGLAILLGDGAAMTEDWRMRKGRPLQIINLGNCNDLLSINKTENGLMIDANVYAVDGYLAVRIAQNEFHVVQQETAYPDRQGRSGLAVYDRKGNVLLWVRYINSHTVSIRGTFTCPSGGQIRFTDSGTLVGQGTQG
jgi:hypothetical protein